MYSAIPENLRTGSGDVLCFDEEASKCYLVGRFSANGILIDDAFRDKVAGRLLFTTSPLGNMAERTRIIKMENRGKRSVQWPEFWPENLKGDK